MVEDKTQSPRNVVIVGGGWAGTLAARQLSAKLDASKYRIILVNDRPYFIHLIATARMTVTPEDKLEDKALVPFDRLFHNGNGTTKIGKVVSISETAPGKGGKVILEDGEEIPYAALVLATGSIWSGPINFPQKDADVRAHISSWRNKYEKARHVVIVGGGAVGLETAGEVKEAWPTKKVTLVHSEKLLLNDTYPDKFRKDIERRARLKGINLILGDKLDIPPEGAVGVKTYNGKEIPDADLVVPSFGSRPNTGFISTLGEDVVTAYGTVRVDQHLEVPGHPGVFAAGDIIDWKEQKQAAKANTHASVVAANVINFLEGQPLSKVYKGSWELIVIPLGKTGGSGYFGVLWGIVVGDWFTRMVKAKELMVSQARKARGY
ncbi:FAD/NAD-P-binding domain-containing protein [Trametes coccinea BRFM310]|uniref:FAD/NAD-P-binding domain-containing protein n=1 Tax=Trametes coccinea (strain BRFM310) TaxID=1353009 RepID=A0A1Y2IBI5_TRAC3|nr:FAD/NAD-P-binding domain-containing protein [Trametes coccinea BRFM310]